MYCVPCRVERLGTARFCVICGNTLLERPREELEADLARVRWLLAELVEWDSTSVAERPRKYVLERYRQREKILLSALEHGAADAPDAEVTQLGAAAENAEQFAARAAGENAEQFAAGAEAENAEQSVPGVLLEAQPDVPSVEDRIVTEASSWSRIWKPFLNESIGWFIGAFLILSGTFYLVSDSWSDMTSTIRALVVFGLAAGWTLGFSAWAQFLWRRETTRGAARVLKLIGAAMAPLAPFAVGPVAIQYPIIAAPLVLGWCVIAAALTLGVTRDLQKVGLRNVPLAMAACSAIMGLAPLIARFHGAALWLMVIPIGLLWANSRSGAGAHGPNARLFAFFAPLYLAAIFGARLHYALIADALTWGTWAPFIAIALTAALELRAPVGPDGRPRWERAADPLSVLVVGAQLGLMVWALTGAAPAFFVTSVIGAHTSWRLLRGSSSPLAPRWIYSLYFFTYFAWQTCGQLIPGFLTELLADLKARLGYEPSGTLPFAYNAVYAAVFVIAGAALAVWWLKGSKRAWAEPLLRCTWITTLLTVALAVSSLNTDTRPAMISVPLLMALCLGLGLWLDRPAFTRVGAAITLAFAATLMVWAGPQNAALPVACVALLLGVLSVPYVAAHRVPLSWAGFSLVAVAVASAWVMPGNAGQVAALAIAFGAAWLIARNLDLPIAQEAAWLIPAVLVARALVLWAPEYAALGLAIAALALAVLARSAGRLRHAELASGLAALIAPAWQFIRQEESSTTPIFLGAVLLLSAAALAAGARRSGSTPTAGWRDALAICFGALALLPAIEGMRLWPEWSELSAAAAYAVLGLAASIWAAFFGRSWRPALLASLTIVLSAVVCFVAEDNNTASRVLGAALGAAGALATMRALFPAISVPLATLFALRATAGDPTALIALAAGLSMLALFEEWDFTWTKVLGKARVAWAASVSAVAVLAGLVLAGFVSGAFRDQTVQAHWLVAAVLPLLWVRATRSAVLSIVLAPLILLAATIPGLIPDAPWPAWIVAGSLIALTQLLERAGFLRSILFGAEDAPRLRQEFAPWVLTGAILLGATLVVQGGSGLPWLALMLLAASELLALRLVVAALFAVRADGFDQLAAAALIALAFLERIVPGFVSKLLGAKPDKATVPAAVASAIGLAAFAMGTSAQSQAGSSAWLLAATLAAGALLLNQRWLFAGAVLAAALPISIEGWEAPSAADFYARAGWIGLGAAALAAVLRLESLQARLRTLFARLGSPLEGDLASPFWLGSTLAVSAVLVLCSRDLAPVVPLLAAGALLLFTPHRYEVAAAAILAAALPLTLISLPVGAAVLGAAGFTLCLLGALLEKRLPSALAWHHAGWALSLVALGGGVSLHHPATAIAWGFAAGCGVVMAGRNPALEWARWVGLAAATHVALFYLGLTFSTGAPRQLILPWIATASLILGAIAIKLGKSSGRVQQRFNAARALMGLGMVELLAGLVLLHGGEAREAIVALFGISIALWALAGRVLEDDDASSAAFAGLLLPLGFVAVRRLAFGAGPDGVETMAALVAGAGIGGLARWLTEGGQKRAGAVARSFAFWWPLAGLAAAPWNAPWTLCLLLLAQSAHFAVVARSSALKRSAAMLSTVAFNAAMVCAFVASGQHGAEYLLIPFGLSLLTLLKVFEADLTEDTRVKLRAVAVTLVYGAASFRPLTFDTTGALWLCVTLCVIGVALGIALKVRSYVYLGTAFMVTTVVANLVRYGVREPRVGAVFLFGLGLAVVGFMVLVTTKRSELALKYQRARSLLQQWEG